MSGSRIHVLFPVAVTFLVFSAGIGILPAQVHALDIPVETSAPDSMAMTADAGVARESAADEPGYGIHLQVGALYRCAHSVDDSPSGASTLPFFVLLNI